MNFGQIFNKFLVNFQNFYRNILGLKNVDNSNLEKHCCYLNSTLVVIVAFLFLKGVEI